jgi:histidyl-tRNA synthetase
VDASGDKIPGLGLSGEQVDRIARFIALPRGSRQEVLAALAGLFAGVASAPEALDELRFLCDSLDRLGIPETHVRLDLSIARGLDYYTGPVFEAILTDAPEFGSVFGGGRYDGLVERFLGRSIPAVGASVGIDRLLAALLRLGIVDAAPATAEVVVTVMEPARIADYMALARELRQAGIKTEMYLGDEKGLGKQLQYANRLQIPFALIVGSDEFSRGEVTIKNLALGAQLQDKKKSMSGKDREEWLRLSRSVQVTVPKDGVVARLREMLSEHHRSA